MSVPKEHIEDQSFCLYFDTNFLRKLTQYDKMNLRAREIEEGDIEPLLNYWFKAEPKYLTGMGTDLEKMLTITSLSLAQRNLSLGLVSEFK